MMKSKTLDEIYKHFKELEKVLNEDQETKENLLGLHEEHYTVNHCVRWGLQAIEEVLSDD